MALMTTKQLAGQIKSIKSNTKKVREQIQEALISCAYQASRGNLNYFNAILEAVGTATRIKGLTLWAETYGFVVVKNEKFVLNKSAVKEANVTSEEDFVEFEKVMRASPMWFDMVPKESVQSIFDAGHYLSGVLTKLQKENCDELVPFIKKAIDDYNAKITLAQLAVEEMARIEALVATK